MQIIAKFKTPTNTTYYRAYHKGDSFTLVRFNHKTRNLLAKGDDLYFCVMRQTKSQEFGYTRKVFNIP